MKHIKSLFLELENLIFVTINESYGNDINLKSFIIYLW